MPDSCNLRYYNLYLILNQTVQYSLARAVLRVSEYSHINSAIKSLLWLKIKQRIDTSFVLSHTKSSLPLNLRIFLFSLIVALVLQMS